MNSGRYVKQCGRPVIRNQTLLWFESAHHEVTAKGRGISTVTWSGAYTPAPGKEKDASDALTGVYESGLAAIKTKLAR